MSMSQHSSADVATLEFDAFTLVDVMTLNLDVTTLSPNVVTLNFSVLLTSADVVTLV